MALLSFSETNRVPLSDVVMFWRVTKQFLKHWLAAVAFFLMFFLCYYGLCAVLALEILRNGGRTFALQGATGLLLTYLGFEHFDGVLVAPQVDWNVLSTFFIMVENSTTEPS